MTLQIDLAGRLSRVSVERRGSSRYLFTIDGQATEVDAVPFEGGTWSLRLADATQHVVGVTQRSGSRFTVHLSSGDVPAELVGHSRGTRRGRDRAPGLGSGPARILAPMPGKVVRVLVTTGQRVEAGDGIVVVEAMKMENELKAPRTGVVTQLAVRVGLSVEAGSVLAVVE